MASGFPDQDYENRRLGLKTQIQTAAPPGLSAPNFEMRSRDHAIDQFTEAPFSGIRQRWRGHIHGRLHANVDSYSGALMQRDLEGWREANKM
jgi:hypothetical protein